MPAWLRHTLILLCSACPLLAAAAPRAEVWERWTRHDDQSEIVVNHTLWDNFLQRYVVASKDGINRLRYSAISSDDRGLLSVYLSDLQRTAVSRLRSEEQRAYWINLYNAFTVKLVLDRYPVSSIRAVDITPGWFSKGPWGAKLIKVEDQTLSLDDIEHRILRPIWKDPRIHYALNCAAIGCPNLANRAYTASSMEALLDGGARAYVNHPRGVRVEDGRLYLSSLYDWYEADFGGNVAGVIEHLRRYAEPELDAQLAAMEKISGDDYDWSLNDAK